MTARLGLGTLLAIGLLVPTLAAAQATAADTAFIKLAESGGPADISSKAAVDRIDPKAMTVKELRPGTNGFTCSVIPDGTNAPFCGDQNAWTWFRSAFTMQPKPTNAAPGIAYMAKGGIHYETPDGAVVMEKSATTKDVAEPPHWMLMWAFDPAAAGLPDRPNAAGVYVMFAGTPYAHLMVYQDPNKLKTK
jgi:hypothetical protein